MRLPAGFSAAGVAAGIKPAGLDLAMIAAAEPVPAAAVFTQSAAPAAPVQLSRRHLADGLARAVVLNSGCANAATGEQGLGHAERMASAASAGLDTGPSDVVVCSTGVIGTSLPIERIEAAMPQLVAELASDGAEQAAQAMMTTDTTPKMADVDGPPHVVGVAKGAGMIRPDMATMLAVITTDAAVDSHTLGQILSSAVDVSFNALSVDGCMSTNDTVVAMASGRAAGSTDLDALGAAFARVCTDLAKQIAADGEGATKVVTIEVAGTATNQEARALGLAIADSALVRSSFAAADPNWGRVIAAIGAAGQDPTSVDIAYEGALVAQLGRSAEFDGALRQKLAGDFTLSVVVGDGPGRAEVFTCDLTPAYVVENMETS